MDIQTLGFQIYFAFVSAYLSVILARVLHQNGRVLKRWTKDLRRFDIGLEFMAKLLVEQNERIRKEILEALGKP